MPNYIYICHEVVGCHLIVAVRSSLLLDTAITPLRPLVFRRKRIKHHSLGSSSRGIVSISEIFFLEKDLRWFCSQWFKNTCVTCILGDIFKAGAEDPAAVLGANLGLNFSIIFTSVRLNITTAVTVDRLLSQHVSKTIVERIYVARCLHIFYTHTASFVVTSNTLHSNKTDLNQQWFTKELVVLTVSV